MGFAFWACVQRPVERGETEQEIPEKNNKQKKKVGNQVYTKYERVLFFSVGTLWRQIGRKLWKRFFIWNKKKKREKLSQFGAGGVWEFYCEQDKLTRDDKFGPAGW